MTVAPVSSATASTVAVAAPAASSATSGSVLGLDFTSYLKILTTQLKNQDPTNATDPNQYTQELVQMEGVQQQINTDNDLKSLVTAETSKTLASGVGYIGTYVQSNASNGAFALQGSTAEFGYTLPGTAASSVITVQDTSGATVATLAGGTASGPNLMSWNGQNAAGTTLPDGNYTFSVAALDSSGKTLTTSNQVVLSKITGAQSSTAGTLNLLANGLTLSSSDVTAIYTAATLPTATRAQVTG